MLFQKYSLRQFFFLSLFSFLIFVASRAILTARAPSPGDVSGHPIVKVKINFLPSNIALMDDIIWLLVWRLFSYIACLNR